MKRHGISFRCPYLKHINIDVIADRVAPVQEQSDLGLCLDIFFEALMYKIEFLLDIFT